MSHRRSNVHDLTIYHTTAPLAGVRLDAASAAAEHAPGTRVAGNDGTEWLYVRAGGKIARHDYVTVDEGFKAKAGTKGAVDDGHVVAVAQTAFADKQYGWVATCGQGANVKVNVGANCAADRALYTSADRRPARRRLGRPDQGRRHRDHRGQRRPGGRAAGHPHPSAVGRGVDARRRTLPTGRPAGRPVGFRPPHAKGRSMEAPIHDAAYWETFAAEQQSGGRDDCIPHFYMRAIRNPARSEETGRPVFDEAAYVRILAPGDRNSVVDRKVTDDDRARWPRAWAAFQAKRGRPAGTPIEHWPYLTVAGAAELKAAGALTVEEVAGADDALREKIGERAAELAERAKQFLQPQPETETALRVQIGQLERDIAERDTRIAALEAEMRRRHEARRQGRGR